jgi:hypothetical protein
MKLPRFTVRRLMVAVAIVAIMLGVGAATARLFGLSRAYQYRAREFAELQATTDPAFPLPTGVTALNIPEYRLRCDRRRVWMMAMEKKYESAARYPWLPIEPDMPDPH